MRALWPTARITQTLAASLNKVLSRQGSSVARIVYRPRSPQPQSFASSSKGMSEAEPTVLSRLQASQDDGRIVVGVIGAGGNTRAQHIPKLQAIQGVEVRTVCNRTVVSGIAVAKQLNIPQVTDDWRAVLKDPEISAVVIGTWPYMHALLTIEALKAGKHVLCEARAAMDAREAHEMLRVSRQNPGLVVQIVPSPFTLPYDATIRDIIRSGKLGRLTYIEVRGVSSQYPDPPGAPMHFRQNREYSGLNILTMGIFYEALVR